MIGLTVVGGDGDGESGTAAASIPKAEFLSRANAACAKIHGQAQAGFAAYLKSQSTEPNAAQLGQKFVIVPKPQEVEEFKALGAPSGDEAQVEAIIVAYQKDRKAEEDPAQVARNSTEAFGTPEKLALEYGLKGC